MRLLGHRSATRIYKELRKHGAIPKLQRKRQKVYDIPEPVLTAIGEVGISYLQWCNSHNIEPGWVEEGLTGKLSFDDEVTVVAHDMLVRDFPEVYCGIFGKLDLDDRRLVTRITNFPSCENIVTEYDAAFWTHIASSEEYPDIKGMGWTTTAARVDFGRKYMIRETSLALRRAPEHPGPIFKMRKYL